MSFTVPFLLGQFSILLLLYLSLKFFLFSSAHSPSPAPPGLSSVLRSHPLSSSPPSPPGDSNRAESLQWFNKLLSHLLIHLRNEAFSTTHLVQSLQTALNASRPEWLEEIIVTDLSLGDVLPVFSECRVVPNPDRRSDAHLLAPPNRPPSETRMKLFLAPTTQSPSLAEQQKDMMQIAISTRLVLNHPRPLTAILPVKLSVALRRFEGTLSLAFIAPPTPTPPESTSNVRPPTAQADDEQDAGDANGARLEIALLPDYTLDLEIRSLIGSRSKLEDVPKVRELVEGRIRDWVSRRVVWPRVWDLAVPRLWAGQQTDSIDCAEAETDVTLETRSEGVSTRATHAMGMGEEGLRRRGPHHDTSVDTESSGWIHEGYTMPGGLPGMGSVL